MNATREVMLPYSVHRFLSGLSEPMKSSAHAHIERYIQNTGTETVTVHEATGAISYAASEFEKDAELSLDPDMAARSMKAYEDGDWQEIEDVIDELQGAAA